MMKKKIKACVRCAVLGLVCFSLSLLISMLLFRAMALQSEINAQCNSSYYAEAGNE
ncbi:MAG: hypothetical protein WC340_15600 [Kiritimatiellia bacterium]